MNELDDRLAGDPVWELFPYPTAGPARGSHAHRFGRWLAIACLVAASWLLSPSLAVVTACLAIPAVEFRNGRLLSRSIPDKAGGTIAARFTYAWGALKLGLTAFAFMFATVFALGRNQPEVPPAFLVSLFLCMGGYLLSATLTAAGLVRAYRSGMRVWVGEGVNQARTLLLAMLIVGFAVAVLGPMCIWLAASASQRKGQRRCRPCECDHRGDVWFHVDRTLRHARDSRQRLPTRRRRPTRQVWPKGADGGKMELSSENDWYWMPLISSFRNLLHRQVMDRRARRAVASSSSGRAPSTASTGPAAGTIASPPLDPRVIAAPAIDGLEGTRC